MNRNKEWPSELPRIVAVRPSGDYRLELKFNDGTVGEVDLAGWVVGAGGVFEPLRDAEFFRRVRVNPEAGTIEWPTGVDLCPDVLYSRATGTPIPFAESQPPAAAKA